MQETRGQSLFGEDPTCPGTTKPLSHNCWAQELKLLKAELPRACAPQKGKQLQWEAHLLQLDKAQAQQAPKKTQWEMMT